MIRFFLLATLGLYTVLGTGCSAPGDPPPPNAMDHDNIRGADYFDSSPEAEPPVIP